MQFLRFTREVINALASTRKMAKMSSEELLSLNDENLYKTIALRLAYDTRWKKVIIMQNFMMAQTGFSM